VPPDLDPAALTADERLRELAALLASGVLRLRDRDALSARPGKQATAKSWHASWWPMVSSRPSRPTRRGMNNNHRLKPWRHHL
jgi:hypothetical protein